MQSFERIFMRTLRHVYDAERQLFASLPAIGAASGDLRLGKVLLDIEAQSKQQAERIEEIFRTLYLEPQAEASWVTTALLRDAWDSCSSAREGGTPGCAAALLALKRYEITLYEALLRWSEACSLGEVAPAIRRSIAEELVQACALSELAFASDIIEAPQIVQSAHGALH